MSTIATALSDPRLPRLETRLLLAHALGHVQPESAQAWLLARDHERLPSDVASRFEQLVLRRLAGEPIAYLIGQREFYGRSFLCTPAALIPRPETEHLIEAALERLPQGRQARVLDVGSGSGCIAITIALERPQAEVLGLDISEDALALATRNAARLGASRVRFLPSDWLAALPSRARFALILANPPYIRDQDSHLFQGDLRFEPWLALTDRADGLSAYRILAAEAPHRLEPGGWLIVEHGFDQAEAVQALFAAAGLKAIETRRDLAGQPRITLARQPD